MTAWLLAAGAVGLWLLLLFIMAAATRNPDVKPGPATGELADQSPAVVDLITGNWRLCDEAPSATVLDLAAKGALGIEEVGPELSLVRLRRDPGGLTPYEQLVYDHVRSLAVDGVVATGALAEGSRDISRWWKSFRKKVIVEARAQGLSRPRWSRANAALLTAAAAVPSVAVGIAASISDTEEHSAGLGAFVVVYGLLLTIMGKFNGERGTELGARAAAHWLGVRQHLAATGQFAEQPAASVTIWGRHLAYAGALGLAPRAVGSLPVSTPADDRRAWSDYGGMWHVVDVRYPSRLFWGRPPLNVVGRALAAAFFAGFWTWLGLVVASAFDFVPSSLATPAGITVAAVVAGLPIVYAISDLTGGTAVQGQIVRLRKFQSGTNGDNDPKYAYWCAIDEGRSREVKAFGIKAELWGPLEEGDQVKAVAGRRLGWIREIGVVERSRMREMATYDDTSEHLIDAPENLGQVKVFKENDRDGGERGGDGGVSPAGLVTPADLERTLGIEVGAVRPYSGRPLAPDWLRVESCSYSTGTGWSIDVHAGTGKRSRYLMVLGHMLTRAEAKPVQGIGRQAMLYPGVVAATTDQGTFAIIVSTPDGPPPPDPLLDLARTAAARLGGS
jgi:hypothetical protein